MNQATKWTFDGDRNIHDEQGRDVCRADWDINDDDGSRAEWEKNARLIAAAPRLLAALRKIEDDDAPNALGPWELDELLGPLRDL